MRKEIEKLALSVGYSKLNFCLNPNKELTEKDIIEDIGSLLKSINNKEIFEEIYSTE